jgi:hypothetical protein
MRGLLIIFRLAAMSFRFLDGLFDAVHSFIKPIAFTRE